MNTVTPLVDTAFRGAVRDRIEHGPPNERALAELLLGIYDRSCEMPRVVTFVNEWALGVLNES